MLTEIKISGILPIKEIRKNAVIAYFLSHFCRMIPTKIEMHSADVCKTPLRKISPDKVLIMNLFIKKPMLVTVHKMVTKTRFFKSADSFTNSDSVPSQCFSFGSASSIALEGSKRS